MSDFISSCSSQNELFQGFQSILHTQDDWEVVIQLIISLPDKLNNKGIQTDLSNFVKKVSKEFLDRQLNQEKIYEWIEKCLARRITSSIISVFKNHQNTDLIQRIIRKIQFQSQFLFGMFHQLDLKEFTRLIPILNKEQKIFLVQNLPFKNIYSKEKAKFLNQIYKFYHIQPQALISISEIWGDTNFLQHSPEKNQCNNYTVLTIILYNLLQQTHQLNPHLLNGVQIRLNSQTLQVRNSGIVKITQLIASQLQELSNTQKHFHFSLEQYLSDTPMKENSQQQEIELQSYQPINYLQDLLSKLKSSNMEDHLSALKTASELIQADLADLSFYTEQLVNTLLKLSNAFNFQNFDSCRKEAIVSLGYIKPQEAISSLVRHLKQSTLGLGMLIMDSLAGISFKLANPPSGGLMGSISKSSKTQPALQVIRNRLKQKTRYISRPTQIIRTSPNLFLQYFQLTCSGIIQKLNSDIHQILLIKGLHTIAQLLRNTGLSRSPQITLQCAFLLRNIIIPHLQSPSLDKKRACLQLLRYLPSKLQDSDYISELQVLVSSLQVTPDLNYHLENVLLQFLQQLILKIPLLKQMAIYLVLGLALAQNCNSRIKDWLGSLANDWYTGDVEVDDLSPILYSGKGLFDMGHYQQCTRSKNTYYYVRLRVKGIRGLWGVCMPQGCTQEQTTNILLSLIGNQEDVFVKTTKPYEEQFSILGWIFLLINLILIGLGAFGAYKDYKSKDRFSLVQAFSFIRSFRSLFQSRSEQKLKERTTLDVLDAIRVMAFGWVLWGSIISYRIVLGIINIDQIFDIASKPWFIIGVTAHYGVDTFLFLSGILAGFYIILILNTEGSSLKVLIKIWFLRFARIYPLLVFMAAFNNMMLPALGDGPNWWFVDRASQECGDYWWTVLVFLNNFIPDGIGNTCYRPTWYIAVQMQLFVLGIILVWLYFKLPKFIGFLINYGVLTVAYVVTITVSAQNDYKVNALAPENMENNMDYKFNFKPYIRMVPYLVGLDIGLLMYALLKRKQQLETRSYDKRMLKMVQAYKYNWVSLISFIAGVGVITFQVWIHVPVYQHLKDYEFWNSAENLSFLSFERFMIAKGLAFILLPLLLGKLKIIRRFLQVRPMRMLSRINYGCFLASQSLVLGILSNENTGIVLNGLSFFKYWVSIWIFSTLAAFYMYFVVEYPVRNILKWFNLK